MLRTVDSGFDAIVVDKEEHAFALLGLKAHLGENWGASLSRQQSKLPEQIAFVLTIDPQKIKLYKKAGENFEEPIVQFETQKILQQYDPEFSGKRVFEYYLLTLVEAWLRDLAYHWNSKIPPGTEELRRVGFLELLDGGTTQRLGA